MEKAQLLANIEKVKREDAEKLAAKRKQLEIMNKEVRISNKNAEEQKIAARETERKVDK